MTTATESTCASCAYWRRLSLMDDEHGYCRRFPPNIYVEHSAEFVQPIIHESNWCGEWMGRDRPGFFSQPTPEQQEAVLREGGEAQGGLFHCSGCGEAWNQSAEGLECPRCSRPAPDIRASAKDFVEKHRDMLKRLADE